MGHEDHPFPNPAKWILLPARQVVDNPLPHGSDVGCAASQVFVFDGFEELTGLEQGSLEGPVGIEPFFPDQAKCLVVDRRVSKDHLVDLEDPDMFLLIRKNPCLDPFKVLVCLVDGILERRHSCSTLGSSSRVWWEMGMRPCSTRNAFPMAMPGETPTPSMSPEDRFIQIVHPTRHTAILRHVGRKKPAKPGTSGSLVLMIGVLSNLVAGFRDSALESFG